MTPLDAARRGLEAYRKRQQEKRAMGDTDELDDWLKNYVANARHYAAQVKPKDPIETATDDVLILELIKRGYAVAKMKPDELAEAMK